MARTKKTARAKNPPPPSPPVDTPDEAETVVECFFSLLDASAHSPSAFTEDLIHLFESPTRREPLLRSWKAWREKNSQPQKSPPTVRITNIKSGAASVKTVHMKRAPAPAPPVGAWHKGPPVAQFEEERTREIEGNLEPVRGRKKRVVVAWG